MTDVRTVVTLGDKGIMPGKVLGSLWRDRNVLYFDLGARHRDIQMCKNSSGCAFKIFVFTICMLNLHKDLKIVS